MITKSFHKFSRSGGPCFTTWVRQAFISMFLVQKKSAEKQTNKSGTFIHAFLELSFFDLMALCHPPPPPTLHLLLQVAQGTSDSVPPLLLHAVQRIGIFAIRFGKECILMRRLAETPAFANLFFRAFLYLF